MKNKRVKKSGNEELIWLGQGWQLVKKPIDEGGVRKLQKELEELDKEFEEKFKDEWWYPYDREIKDSQRRVFEKWNKRR
jgi:hypothetical protein